ncbi:MAG: c-type cytochrome biogenesis protein CcsB [Actinomycetota bacterium]
MSVAQWARISNDAFNVAMFGYVGAMVGYFYYLAFRREIVWRVASTVTWIALGAHVVSVLSRGMAADRVPWGNLYEYSSMLALLIVAAYLVIVEWRYKVKSIGGFVLALVVLTMAVAVSFLYVGPAPLVPALNSYWIKIHVVAAIVGSSLLALGGGVLTGLYLYQDRSERRRDELAASGMPPIAGGATDLDVQSGDGAAPHDLVADELEPASGPRRGGLLPPASTLDRLAYRTIAFAFPIWTFAVIAGAIWAQEAWGRYWGWDPKETWSFIVWVVYAGYLHARATAGWKGRRAATIALIGFAALLVNYYVVNTVVSGLHSYSGV